MTNSPYPPDSVNNYPDDWTPDDNGTMPENVAELAKYVVGRRIIKAENGQTVNLGPYDGKRNYGYGFDIAVAPLEGEIVPEKPELPAPAQRALEVGQ